MHLIQKISNWLVTIIVMLFPATEVTFQLANKYWLKAWPEENYSNFIFEFFVLIILLLFVVKILVSKRPLTINISRLGLSVFILLTYCYGSIIYFTGNYSQHNYHDCLLFFFCATAGMQILLSQGERLIVLLHFNFFIYIFIILVGYLQLLRVLKDSNVYTVTTIFHNSGDLGNYLACLLPLNMVMVFYGDKKRQQPAAIIALVLAVVLLYITKARIAWVAFVIVTVLAIYKYKIHKKNSFLAIMAFKRFPTFLIVVLCLMLSCGLYFLKPDSVKGRILIYKVCLDIFQKHPLTGIGINQFNVQYNNYQSSYIEKHQLDPLNIYADNIYVAFNDYLEILLELGFIGSAFLLLVLKHLIRFCRSGWNATKIDGTSIVIECSFIAFLICAMFSYPIRNIYVLFYMAVCIAIILKTAKYNSNIIYSLVLKPNVLKCLTGIVAIIIGICMCNITQKMLWQIRWQKTAEIASTDKWDEAMSSYTALYPHMKGNGQFLYNYGAELSLHERYEQSNIVLLEAAKYYTHSNLYTYLGINYQALKRYSEAERYYLHAIYMVPSRLLTKYLLFNMYRSTNEHEKAGVWAKNISNTKIKVPNETANEIKSEAASFLKRF